MMLDLKEGGKNDISPGPSISAFFTDLPRLQLLLMPDGKPRCCMLVLADPKHLGREGSWRPGAGSLCQSWRLEFSASAYVSRLLWFLLYSLYLLTREVQHPSEMHNF